jgi:ABC-type dipeptide/oligopeptide/nickel transport system permease component
MDISEALRKSELFQQHALKVIHYMLEATAAISILTLLVEYSIGTPIFTLRFYKDNNS